MIHIIYHEVKPGTPCPDGIMSASIAALFCQNHQIDFNINW